MAQVVRVSVRIWLRSLWSVHGIPDNFSCDGICVFFTLENASLYFSNDCSSCHRCVTLACPLYSEHQLHERLPITAATVTSLRPHNFKIFRLRSSQIPFISLIFVGSTLPHRSTFGASKLDLLFYTRDLWLSRRLPMLSDVSLSFTSHSRKL